ncbi:hypothetical protein GGR52DRAFT_531179 [Hypoxylon sp. FL1284]|nr:hypothetical protein GGR52DRAFT_531179 [Hypoxylon sp. FL1284]
MRLSPMWCAARILCALLCQHSLSRAYLLASEYTIHQEFVLVRPTRNTCKTRHVAAYLFRLCKCYADGMEKMRNAPATPQLHRQPVAVDFVDNRLPDLHPAFSHPSSKYDIELDRYIPVTCLPPHKMQADYLASHASVPGPARQAAICGPPAIILSMRFWDKVFPDAMKRLQEKFDEPKDRRATGYNIRGMEDWDQVYQQVERCREKYLSGSLSLNVKKGWRKFADNIGPLQESLKLIPDVDYVTPVRGTLEFIVDAIKRSSETRQKLLEGLDELDSIFKDIELFLITFPTEENVIEAGIELVLSVLVAVERLIGFYLKHKVKKAFSALFNGDEYGKEVIDSLQDITRRSESLRHEATKADMSQSAKNWKIAEQRHEELLQSQILLQNGQERIIRNQDNHAGNLTRTIQVGVQIMNNGMNDIYNLIVEYERNKEQWQRRNEALELEVSELKNTTNNLQRAITPSPIQAPRLGWHMTPDSLWGIFGPLGFDDVDMQYALEKQEHVPLQDRAIAESLVAVPRFREWMVAATSRELLIHGNSTSNLPVSSLSVFCSTFSQALRQNPKFISLVYFCALHADYDDLDAGPPSMMKSFIAQLILQGDFNTTALHHYVDISWAEFDEEPDMDDLCGLVRWMVRQLPANMTVFCVIDGANAYEKNGYVHGLTEGLACIMDLTIDPRVQATVKVLVTSPGRTLEIRQGFDDDDTVALIADRFGTSMETNQRHFQHRISRALEDNE